MGLDYETLKVKFPKLVMGQLGAYGTKGPDKDKPGYDNTACRNGRASTKSILVLYVGSRFFHKSSKLFCRVFIFAKLFKQCGCFINPVAI